MHCTVVNKVQECKKMIDWWWLVIVIIPALFIGFILGAIYQVSVEMLLGLISIWDTVSSCLRRYREGK